MAGKLLLPLLIAIVVLGTLSCLGGEVLLPNGNSSKIVTYPCTENIQCSSACGECTSGTCTSKCGSADPYMEFKCDQVKGRCTCNSDLCYTKKNCGQCRSDNVCHPGEFCFSNQICSTKDDPDGEASCREKCGDRECGMGSLCKTETGADKCECDPDFCGGTFCGDCNTVGGGTVCNKNSRCGPGTTCQFSVITQRACQCDPAKCKKDGINKDVCGKEGTYTTVDTCCAPDGKCSCLPSNKGPAPECPLIQDILNLIKSAPVGTRNYAQ